jgi:beta-lactamase regulating signal transducer with metallopeptidase domain
MENIFNIVLTTSAYAAIVGLVIVFMKYLLRNKLNAKWHYFIWIVLILKLLVPFGPESAYSLFNALPQISYNNTNVVDNNTAYSDQASTTTNQVLSDEGFISNEVNQANNISLRENVLPYVWASGAFLMLLWLAASYLALYRKVQKASTIPDDRIQQVYEGCKTEIGVHRNISILMQEVVAMPSLFGVFKPKILLSPTVAKLSDKELEYILMHELAHFKRKDIFANYLLLVLQIIHWFNPVVWYCFNCIRQDMELATDELVLSKLQDTEHRDYGRALITILEGFSTPKLAPRLLAMADDKRNIEKRLKMIKMTELFMGKRRFVIIVGLLCIALLSSILLTNRITKEPSAINITPYNAEELYKYKTPFVGDNSKVANLIGGLPYGEFMKEVSLQTKTQPYGVRIEYNFGDSDIKKQFVGNENLLYNSAIMFALIDNLDFLEFKLDRVGETYRYDRVSVQKQFPTDLREYSMTLESFKLFLQSRDITVWVTPGKYSPLMSSTPGIEMKAFYLGSAKAESVVYTTQGGSLFTYGISEGKISEGKQKLEVSFGTSAYWTPFDQKNSGISNEQDSIVRVTLLDKDGKKLAETQVTILNEGAHYYNVKHSYGVAITPQAQDPLSIQKPQSIDEAVRRAIKSRATSYRAGEVATEGHIMLDTEEDDSMIKVYTIASIGNFGFENGIFTLISGSGAIPTVITFSNKENNKYELLEFKEPLDGGGYTDSIKKMFPSRLHNEVLNAQKYGSDLANQQEVQAAEYLKSIGRVAKISTSHVNKVLVDINVEASNKLFSEFGKYDAFINSCPYWNGMIEQIENGIRYVYETSQSKTSDGYDLVIFKKTDSDGNIIKEAKYKIIGSEPQLVE